MEEPRINTFGTYMRNLYGENVSKVNVDAGFTCPNRDGTVARGGCIFCNNDSFRPDACKPMVPPGQQIENGIRYTSRRYKAKLFLAYFQPFTNTHAPVETLERLYREALSHDGVIGLAIGTRPDSVDEEKLALLEELARDNFILVEYGLQSIHDRTLRLINRGHTYKQFLDTVEMSAGRGIHVGAHIILGLPGETREDMLCAADEISRLPVEFLKLHQLQVIKNTQLEQSYKENPFPMFEYEDYVSLVCDFLERLSPEVHIQRFCATAPLDILIAPRWSLSRHHLLLDIRNEMIRRNSYQGAVGLVDRASLVSLPFES